MTRRIDAARHVLGRRNLLGSMALNRQPFLRNSLLAGAQAGLAVAIALPLALLSPWPELTGFAALGALVALFGRFAPRRGPVVLACGLCQVAAVTAMSLAVWAGAPAAVQLALLALSCGVFFFVTVSAGFGAPGALIFVFAAGAAMGHQAGLAEIAGRAAATGAAALLAWAICALTEHLRPPESEDRPFPAEPRRPLPERLVAALRIIIGCGSAAFACHALGAAHPAWAAMGALAVMQGAHLHINMQRAVQRMTGTAIGAVLAWAILNQVPGPWEMIAALVLLQFLTETVIGANYALGQALVTPMALLMSHLAAPQADAAAMAPERVLDTLLGVSLGMLAALVFSTLDDRRRLAQG
ncbi:FUSC family protein [Paracoccus aminovorans]|uniref:FUSC family protein n=1 Tax=Paracoccus aminovorans TaxID=34004 RepID=UPI000783A165|nr:FUSC family protein [Paracoccus aminovorans]MDQ7774536.1 FUSC family protein [Paracoccus aminovorans]